MRKIGAVILLILLISISSSLYADEMSVHIAGGIEKIGSFEEKNIIYFSMSQLSSILGERISWEKVGFSTVFSTDSHLVKFFINSPYINIDDTVKNLTCPVRFKEGNLYLPVVLFIPILDLIRSEQISWDRDRKSIRIESEWYNITDLAFSPKTNGLLIEIFISEPKEYEIYISEGNWLNVTIPDGTVKRRQILSRYERKYLRDINVVQFDKSAQISLRMRRGIQKYTHRFQANPSRIQISLIDSTVTPITMADQDIIGPDDRIDKVVIDAGHGGKDSGAIGLKGTREKKIVMDIAKRLAKLIRKEKIFEIIMTREKDKTISLEQRTKIANDAHGDIFISIHANASLNRSARGFQVFFLAPAMNDEARALAQLENAAFLSEPDAFNAHQEDDLNYILSDMIQTEFQTESADLASMVDKEFRRKLKKKTRARGIDQAGFYVLNGVFMPSILVEAAFITNKEDEKLLNKKNFRQATAEAIYEGLKRFKAKYETQ